MLPASSRSPAVVEPGLKRTTSVVAFVGTWPTPYSADDVKRSSQALGKATTEVVRSSSGSKTAGERDDAGSLEHVVLHSGRAFEPWF
jgi:hypothetical protein